MIEEIDNILKEYNRLSETPENEKFERLQATNQILEIIFKEQQRVLKNNK